MMLTRSLFVQRFSRPSVRAFSTEAGSTNIFVANIPWAASREQLQEHFNQYGAIESVRIITDRETGRSKGYGFVNFTNPEDAAQAVSALDGSEFLGRQLSVRPKENRPPVETE